MNSNELKEKVISFYPSPGRKSYNSYKALTEEDQRKTRPPFRRISTKSMSLEEVAEYISSPMTRTESGEQTLPVLTDEIRNSESEYKDKKTYLLPNVVFGGIPIQRMETQTDKKTGEIREVKTQRKKANFTEGATFSGLIIIDIDHLSDNGVDLRELRDKISQDGELGLRLIFVSPSGDGLKIVCKSKRGYNSPETYEREYFALVNYLSLSLGDIVDTSGKDISRTCFLCHDPEVKLFEPTTFFDSETHPAPIRETPKRRYYYPQSWGTDDGIEELVRRVEESGKDIAPTYEEYFPLVCSFSSLGERGRQYLHRVCSFSTKYDYDDTEYHFEHNVPNEIQHIGYFVNLCKRNGIDTKLGDYYRSIKPQETRQNRHLKEMNEENITKPAEQAKNSLKIDIPKVDDIWGEIAKDREGLETSYKFGEWGNMRPLFLDRERFTLVCGLSSHCKSTFLRNLALDIAVNNKEEGSVIYFTYEDSKKKTYINLFSALYEVKINGSGDSRSLIRQYAKGRKTPPTLDTDTWGKKKQEFEELLTSGKLIVVETNANSPQIVSTLKEYEKNHKIKAIFLDYVQRVSSGRERVERREDLRLVAQDIQDYSKERLIPVVMTAQTKRGSDCSPENMGQNDIAESVDLARYADTIISIWYSKKKRDCKDKGYFMDGNEVRKKLENRNFVLDQPGKILAVLTKYAGGASEEIAVLDYDEAIGRITPEEEDPLKGATITTDKNGNKTINLCGK